MKQKIFVSIALIVVFFAATIVLTGQTVKDVKKILLQMNAQLEFNNENIRLEKVEFLTHDKIGPTVYANDRQHQLDSQWLPYDPWRYGVRDIYWLVDKVDKVEDVSWSNANAAIGRAMNTWNTTPCANIPLVEINDYGLDWGYVQWLVGMGGTPGWYADLTHAGWLPGAFFDTIGGPGGSDSILGATFTFVWTAYPDRVAFREIYYNDKFNWGVDIRYFDIESIVLHEVGHGLSLGHFGKIFRTRNGKLHFAPRAVMNAIYFDIQQTLLGTDIASFCSIWASWPNN
ncbi:MAG: hypothetical protein ABFR36_01455 [Acidobacteriota bacterium]